MLTLASYARSSATARVSITLCGCVMHSSHLHYKRVSWSVLGHSLSVNGLRTLRIVVVQVRDIDRDRCDGLQFLRGQSFLCDNLKEKHHHR